MTDEAVAEEKRSLRRDLSAVRKSLTLDRAAAALRLRDNFLSIPGWDADNFVNQVIGGFWPMGSEIDIRPLLETLADRGHPLALPVVVAPERPLDFRAWRPGDPLHPAGFSTSVPAEDAPLARPNILIVPLLGFDRKGFRIGYGGGFYDRTIAILSTGALTTVGVAFSEQEVDRAPTDGFDRALDFVATDRTLFDCRSDRPDRV